MRKLASGLRNWGMGWFLVAMLLLGFDAAAQQKAGEVEHVQGLATAQQSGGTPRFVAKGDPLFEGDVVTTTEKGYAVLSLSDGSKLTLRPSTSFMVEKYAYGSSDDRFLMRLLKGGLRAVTGLIGKRNPGAVQLNTATATIGIRGTSFDARLCGDDCRREEAEVSPSRQSQKVALPPSDNVAARVVQMEGEVAALQPGKPARKLGPGAPLYVGDEIRTGPQSIAVIGFRDQSRVSLNPETAFRVESFSYAHAEQTDNIAVRLLKGGLRAFTGLIGKKNPSAVSISTVVATIGIRGTGMDISCEGPCAGEEAPGEHREAPAAKTGKKKQPKEPSKAPEVGRQDGLFVHTWEGRIFLLANDRSLDVELERIGFVGRDRVPRLLAALPDFLRNFAAPRPDKVPIDWNNLFGAESSNGEDGLYVLVRDGHVFILTAAGRIDLGAGEGGFVGGDNRPRRLDVVPKFMRDDPFPIPELFSISDSPIIQLYGVTLGNPGQDICEMH